MQSVPSWPRFTQFCSTRASAQRPSPPKTRGVDQGFVAEDDSADNDYEESEGHDSSDDDYYDGTDADTTAHLAIDRLHGNLLDMIHSFVRADKSESASAVRKLWLEHLTANPELVFRSARIRKVVELYKQVRKDHPDLKICVSSQYLTFLDMIKVAVCEECGVEGLKCNVVLPEAIRQGSLDAFKDNADPDIPLLLSGKAGGEGIDLPQASIMIQTEV
jgi:superfamily II DNA or RNA helicase